MMNSTCAGGWLQIIDRWGWKTNWEYETTQRTQDLTNKKKNTIHKENNSTNLQKKTNQHSESICHYVKGWNQMVWSLKEMILPQMAASWDDLCKKSKFCQIWLFPNLDRHHFQQSFPYAYSLPAAACVSTLSLTSSLIFDRLYKFCWNSCRGGLVFYSWEWSEVKWQITRFSTWTRLQQSSDECNSSSHVPLEKKVLSRQTSPRSSYKISDNFFVTQLREQEQIYSLFTDSDPTLVWRRPKFRLSNQIWTFL